VARLASVTWLTVGTSAVHQAHQWALDLVAQCGARGRADRREAGNRRRRGAIAAGVGVRLPAHGIEQ
jgi:hypothetical protein